MNFWKATMKKNLFAILALAGVLSGATASAATIKFTLTLNVPTNTYTLHATDISSPQDAFGIASYGVVLANVTSVDHKSPRDGFGSGPGGVGPAGFTTLRSADGVLAILASQDTTTPTPNLIYGFGQQASSFAAKGIADFTGGTQLEQPVWGNPLLIADGTFVGNGLGPNAPRIDAAAVDTFSNVFVAPQGGGTKSAGIIAETIVIPEPVSIALGGFALLGLVGYRRRLA
jgi:hypothetical protein